MTEITKPKPYQHYDAHEVTDYLKEKYGFTEDDWDEVIEQFADELSNGCILMLSTKTSTRESKLEKTIIAEFGDDNGRVNLHYWW